MAAANARKSASPPLPITPTSLSAQGGSSALQNLFTPVAASGPSPLPSPKQSSTQPRRATVNQFVAVRNADGLLSPDRPDRLPAGGRLPRNGSHFVQTNPAAGTSGRVRPAISNALPSPLRNRRGHLSERPDRPDHAPNRPAATNLSAHPGNGRLCPIDRSPGRRLGPIPTPHSRPSLQKSSQTENRSPKLTPASVCRAGLAPPLGFLLLRQRPPAACPDESGGRRVPLQPATPPITRAHFGASQSMRSDKSFSAVFIIAAEVELVRPVSAPAGPSADDPDSTAGTAGGSPSPHAPPQPHSKQPESRIPRNRKMRSMFDQDIRKQFRVQRIFHPDFLRSHKHQNIPRVKDRTSSHSAAQWNRNAALSTCTVNSTGIALSRSSAHAEHRPAASAVPHKNHRCHRNLLRGQRPGMGRKMRQNPVAPGSPRNRNKRFRAHVGISWPPQRVADLYHAGVLVVGSFHRPHKPA